MNRSIMPGAVSFVSSGTRRGAAALVIEEPKAIVDERGAELGHMLIRAFRVGDEPDLYRVFFSAIHEIAINDYTLEQIDAWVPRSVNPLLWADHMRELSPFVVENDGKPIAYADIQPSGYIDHFFVSALFARQGVGSKLMCRLHEEATVKGIRILTSNVSRTAQPFFENQGFSVVEVRRPVVLGVVIPNALMKKHL